MKRLLCIIALLPFYCFGQNTGTVFNTGATNQATIQKGATGSDSAMVLPVIDTTRGKNYLGSGSVSLRKKGRIIVNSSDSTLYYYDGGKWKTVGGADSTISRRCAASGACQRQAHHESLARAASKRRSPNSVASASSRVAPQASTTGF